MFTSDILPFALWAVLAAMAAAPLLRREAILATLGSRARLWYELAFFVIVALGLVAARYQILVFPHEANLDESQFICQARGYLRTVVPFSQDGATCGPLNYYVLDYLPFIGLPINYLTIRATGFIFIVFTLLFMRRIVALMAGEKPSYLFILPIISFYFFAYTTGIAHYSSELFPDVLLAFSAWLIAKYWRYGRSHFFVLGTVLGSVPFTKLQSAPMAVYLFLVAVGLLVVQGPRRGQAWIKSLLFLALGGLVFPLIIAVPMQLTGTLGDGVYRYIVITAHYGSGIMTKDAIPLPRLIKHFAVSAPQFTLCFLGLMAMSLVALTLLLKSRKRELTRNWLIGLALVAVYFGLSIFAVLKPDLYYTHYLLLLPQPALYLLAWIFRGQRLFNPTFLNPNRLAFACVFWFLGLLPLPLYLYMQHKLPNLYNADPAVLHQPLIDPVSLYVMKVATPQDFMAIWGYEPKYYVESGVPPGVRDFATQYEPFPDPRYDYYRDCYLADLKKNKPKVFLDAAGEFALESWPKPLEKSRATAWPAIAAYLAANYEAPVPVTTTPDKPPVLVYVRKTDAPN